MNRNNVTYNADQVDRIRLAYCGIFPEITPGLSDYWGLNRQRPWSYVTSNFHTSTYEQYFALHSEVQNIDGQPLGTWGKGEALREASRQFGVGYSIGLCPWTDHLLGETYSEDKDRVTILLGHDWYPIVNPECSRSGSPLQTGDALHFVERYWPAAPQAVFDSSTVALFINLYPDYRPPGDPKCGSLRRYGYSYAQCLLGLDATIAALANRFRHIQVISWGANVWEALLPRVQDVARNTRLSRYFRAAPGKVLKMNAGGRDLEYLPIFHPSFSPTFSNEDHLRHLKKGFSSLGLGLPGPSTATNVHVLKARQIDVGTVDF
ncbi:UNVERIFIED_ORG: hypothetical protein J2Y81_001947 [Paraburkholderia sediminicola]|nr:hypothetical protein [Paraburkholderia sediminicola]